ESICGQGSSFIFTMPLYKDEIKENHPDADSNFIITPKILSKINTKREKPNGSHTVLVIDDKPLNQRILADIIEELDWNIILADNGFQALEKIEKNKIDLII